MKDMDFAGFRPEQIRKIITSAVVFALIMGLVIIGLSFLTGASADEAVASGTIDLSKLTDAEILALADGVNREIVSRHIEKTATLERGKYLVGEDIPAGKYIYTDLATGSEWGNFVIYTLDEKGMRNQLRYEPLRAPKDGASPNSFYITLHEGEQMSADCPFSLTICPGALFQ